MSIMCCMCGEKTLRDVDGTGFCKFCFQKVEQQNFLDEGRITIVEFRKAQREIEGRRRKWAEAKKDSRKRKKEYRRRK